MNKKKQQDALFGKFDPVLDSLLKPKLPMSPVPDRLKKGAEQPNSRTAEQPNKEVTD